MILKEIGDNCTLHFLRPPEYKFSGKSNRLTLNSVCKDSKASIKSSFYKLMLQKGKVVLQAESEVSGTKVVYEIDYWRSRLISRNRIRSVSWCCRFITESIG